MPELIDSSVWIDFTRARSPVVLKRFLAPYILSPTAVVAEPIVFEVLRFALPAELKPLRAQFQLFPVLQTPIDLWEAAAVLGRDCRQAGATASAIDLLIASIAISYGAELVTLNRDFEPITRCSPLRVKLLNRP
jgi:predicted nucleic acid-binding protein